MRDPLIGTAAHASSKQTLGINNGSGMVLETVFTYRETSGGAGILLAKLIIDKAPTVPDAPEPPKTAQNVVNGFVLGLIVHFGGANTANAEDHRGRLKSPILAGSGASGVRSTHCRQKEDKQPGAYHIDPFRDGLSPVAESLGGAVHRLQVSPRWRQTWVLVLDSTACVTGQSGDLDGLRLADRRGRSAYGVPFRRGPVSHDDRGSLLIAMAGGGE